jgi:hypothetical protein
LRRVSGDGPLSVLLLCDDSPAHAPNVLEHIRALQRLSRHRVDVFNPTKLSESWLLRLDDYDVVVIHYSIFILSDSYLSPWFRTQLAAFEGLKVQFLQDDYRWVDAITARMRELQIDLLFTLADSETIPLVFEPRLPGVEVLSTLTGYVPTELQGRPRVPLGDRRLDVVYRGRSVPYWLGRLGQEKVEVGREFLARARETSLRCDIAWTEADRIYGEDWYRFLSSSRTTLGTESGASIVDFDGSLQKRTDDYLRQHPTATFDEVQREILAPFEGNVVMNVVSPRVFEAAALGTAMVNFPGRYSGVIEPWVHYIPLEKDFSNFDEVTEAIRDDATVQRLASQAYEDLVESDRYSLSTFVRGFDRELAKRAHPRLRSGRSTARPLRQRLLAAEQLRSAQRRRELPLLVSLRTRAEARATRRLVRRFPAIESLAARGGREGPPEQADRLLRDLVRLAAAAAAHLRELRYFGPAFDVRLELSDDSRRLTLVGTRAPSQDASERAELQDRVAAAIRGGDLEEMVWDNSAVEAYLSLPTVPPSALQIGYHVVGGAHRFTAFLELVRGDPEGAIAALEPLFRGRPGAAVHELNGWSAALLRLVLKPGGTSAQATARLRAVLESKELRTVMATYLRCPEARAEVPIQLLLKDLLHLSLISQSPTDLELDAEDKSLIYRTGAAGMRNGLALEAATVGALERIVWDHSAEGPLVTSTRRPRIAVALDGGVYEFDALPPIARRFPEPAAAALRRAAGSE